MPGPSEHSLRIGLLAKHASRDPLVAVEVPFAAMLDLCERLLNVKRGSKIRTDEGWKSDAQILGVKFTKHLLSLQAINARTGGLGRYAHIDHSSMKVIARAAVETFWVFAYIFRAPTAEMRLYRHTAWRLGGYCERQRHRPLDPVLQEQQAAEAKVIAMLQAQLQQMPEYLALDSKSRAKVAKGEWREPDGWKKMANGAGFSNGYYARVYGYLCSYAHSSYLSILQLNDARDLSDQRKLSDTVLQICTFTMARFIDEYVSLFPETRAVMLANPSLARFARTWNFDLQLLEAHFPANKS